MPHSATLLSARFDQVCLENGQNSKLNPNELRKMQYIGLILTVQYRLPSQNQAWTDPYRQLNRDAR